LILTVDIETLLKCSTPGIYALINDVDKKIDIRYSSNVSNSITTILTQIRKGIAHPTELEEDLSKLRLIVLELHPSNYQTILLHHAYWINKYKELGYTLYRKHIALQYKLKIYIHHMIIHVSFENRNHDSILLGIFDNMEEANEFCRVYENETVLYPYYAINDLSKKYLQELKSSWS
jgi:hypothetical protein